MYEKFLTLWQDPKNRAWQKVGYLEHTLDGYIFRYTAEAELKSLSEAGFKPLPEFPDLHKIYNSSKLFATFYNRVMSSKRPDRNEWLQTLNLKEDADSLQELARSHGVRMTDNLCVVPLPALNNDRWQVYFFINGLRYRTLEEQTAAQNLVPGAKLNLQLEFTNDYDPNAFRVLTMKGIFIGYIPMYLSQEVAPLYKQKINIDLSVEKVNSPLVSIDQRVLCLAQWEKVKNWDPLQFVRLIDAH